MENNHEPNQKHHVTLSESAARRRNETWNMLRDSGVSLFWHPLAIDKVLNASERSQVRSIPSAVAAAIEGEPHLHCDAPELLRVLNGNVEESPFWFGFVRPQTVQMIPASFRGNAGLIDRCTDDVWGDLCRIAQTYVPVGTDATGELRPHYFYNYLRVCLRTVVRKISDLYSEATALSMDDSLHPAQYPDTSSPAPGAGIENRECRAALNQAIQELRRDPKMERAFSLLVIWGLSLRDAGVIAGLSKSHIQRDAEVLVRHLQNVYAKHYGWMPRDTPDVRTVLLAMRTLLEDMGCIHGHTSLTPAPGNVVAFPDLGKAHPDQWA